MADLLETELIESSFRQRHERSDLPHEALAVARDALHADDLHQRRAGLGLMAEIRYSPEACRTVAELATSEGELEQEAEELFSRFTRPRGLYNGGGDGQPPPALVAIKHVLGQAEETATPQARALLLQSKDGVQRHIRMHREEEDEYMNPRW